MRRFRNQTHRLREARRSDREPDCATGEAMSMTGETAPATGETASATGETEPATGETVQARDSLLVVDDEEMNRNMLSRRLERAGFRVEVARDAAEALRMTNQQTFDLILLDQMMPERSGSEVLRELRKLYSAAELPVIMVTAVADSGKVAEALDSGANDYVTKPVDFAVALA